MKITIALTICILFASTQGENIRRERITKARNLIRKEQGIALNTDEVAPKPDISNATASAASSRRAYSRCSSFDGFVFWPTYDSPLHDLDYADPSNVPLESMIRACSKNSLCKGLNTNGYAKSYIKPLREWYQWTSEPCHGMYIKKTPTSSFIVNGRILNSKEITNLKWIARWTVPNFGMSPYDAIRDYIAKGAWWSLKELVLRNPNAFNFNLCNVSKGKDKVIGPLETCPARRAWQVGIAAVQVPNYPLAEVERRATAVYGQDVDTVLGRSAQQAGYNPGSSTYNSIISSTNESLRKAWLLKSHLVGFYFVADEVNYECLISSPKSWCYGTYGGKCIPCGWYSSDAYSIQERIDEVMILLQSLTDG